MTTANSNSTIAGPTAPDPATTTPLAPVDTATGQTPVNQGDALGRRSQAPAASAAPDGGEADRPNELGKAAKTAPVGRRTVSKRKAALPGPRALMNRNRMQALRLLNRFRQLRSIDLAAGLFPEREFKAAFSAAQRLTKGLVARKMARRYRSLSGQTYYALGEPGARWLREHGSETDTNARASASRVCEKTNPEHSLWIAFAVLCSEARGFTAVSEKELLAGLACGRNLSERRAVLSVTDERGVAKALIPDAVAHNGKKAIWFEIDRSERGSGRLADLVALVKSCGAEIGLGRGQPAGVRLTHVVVLCKTERILRKNIARLTGVVPATGRPRLSLLGGKPALKGVAPGVFDVWADVEVRLADGRTALEAQLVGRVHLQLLPTWLSSFSYRPGSRHDGWLGDGYLPFRNLPDGWGPVCARDEPTRDAVTAAASSAS